MEENKRKKIVSTIDLLVAVVILFIGVFVIIMGFSYSDFINSLAQTYGSYSISSPYLWLSKTPIIILTIGLVAIFYGIKRLIDDLLVLV